ncbi:MAG: SusC/RagA family TonB-linked outer membrane protein [Flavobacterium sp.]|nr:SusC/RagA family TonB-linked outer membrane protein [Flavobacterium sp.]
MRKFLTLLVMVVFTTFAMAQNKTVTGKVTDEKGVPVANASVLVKGTTVGVSTTSNGSFTFTVPANAKTLAITSVGFASQEVTISAKIVVILKSTSTTLEEVVVNVPYGTVKKTSFTGSEGTVGAAVFEKQQNTNPLRAIEGQVAGVNATNGGGAPGTAPSIIVRGFGSVNASSAPLYVLNGVPYDGAISALSTDDIESITILKDAAAANLYGSRAANGVVMLTTKTGKRGRPSVNATMREGFSTRGIPEYDRLGTKEYYELFWEAFRNSYYYGSGQTYTQAGQSASNVLTSSTGLVYNAYNVAGNTLVDPTTGKLNSNAQLLWNESWSDALFQNAQRLNPTLSISGADEKSDYYISGAFLNEEGTAKYSGYKRYNFRATVNTKATSWLKTGLNFDGSSDQRDGLFAGGTATSNPFYYSRYMGPIYPVYQHNTTNGDIVKDANGNPTLDFGTPTQMGSRPYAANSNLVGSLTLDVRNQKRINGNVNTYAEARFLKDFTFKTSVSLNYFENNATTYQNSQYGDAAGVKGRSTISATRQTSLTANQVLSWNKDFGNHNVSALAGHENYKFQTAQLSATKTGFSYPGQTALDNAAVVEAPPSSNEDNERIESYFGSVNYNFNKTYFLQGSVRTDGASRFASGVRWGSFYSASVGWVATNEKFLRNTKWLNFLKLRASYGESGNNKISDASGNQLYYQGFNYYFADGVGNFSTPSRLANPNLKWESNADLTGAIEFTIFNKVTGTVEVYDRRSKDLLFLVPLPPALGYSGGTYQNIGQSKNTGLEITLGYSPVRTKNFDWKIDFNITTFKNVLTKLPPTQQVTGIVTGNKKYTEGKSIYDFWLREFAGVDPSTGLSLYYQDVLGTDGKATGVRNLTTDGSKASFYYVGGSSIPKFTGGFTNSFRYKNFDLTVLLTYSYGGKYYDGNYGGLMTNGSAGTAWSTDILKRWQKPGDVTNVPRVQTASGQDYASSRFLIDASYISIKNINLGFDLPKSVAKKLFISNLRAFTSVDNAYIFTAKKGGDPQQDFGGNPGSGYPPYRTITFGLNVKL